jgi:hypothetical protein
MNFPETLAHATCGLKSWGVRAFDSGRELENRKANSGAEANAREKTMQLLGKGILFRQTQPSKKTASW